MDEYCGYKTEDVHSGTELDEVMCEMCGTIQPATNKFCSHCGEKIEKSIVKKGKSETARQKVFTLVISLSVVAVITAVAFVQDLLQDKIVEKIDERIDENSNSSLSVTIPEIDIPEFDIPEKETAEEGVYPRGEYVVGEDIPAGVYLLCSDDLGDSVPDGFGAAYAYLIDDTDTVFDSWFEHSRYAKLEDGQYLDLSWCSAYDISMHTIENNPFEHSGMFKVGVDVEAGTYEVKAIDDNAMYFYYVHGSLEDFNDSAMYDYFRENYGKKTEVILEDGQYLEMYHCVLEKNEQNNSRQSEIMWIDGYFMQFGEFKLLKLT